MFEITGKMVRVRSHSAPNCTPTPGGAFHLGVILLVGSTHLMEVHLPGVNEVVK